MKSNLPTKLIITMCLCFVVSLTFVACKDKEVFAESSDFESYPEYWNDFNDEIFVPDTSDGITGDNNQTSDGSDSSSNDNTTSSEYEDWTANITDDDDENTASGEVDTDKDGISDNKDPDDDNDGVTDDKDPDDDNDGVRDEEENKDKTDYGNQGPFVPLN